MDAQNSSFGLQTKWQFVSTLQVLSYLTVQNERIRFKVIVQERAIRNDK